MNSSHPLSSSSSEPKKKFGKNLNKYTKPPAPSSSTTATASSRVGGTGSTLSSRNGLHLLSTKRSNSLASTSSGGGGGLLGAKTKLSSSTFAQSTSTKVAPRPLNTPSLRSESSNDTSYLSSSAISATVPLQTAWGLSEKSQQQTNDKNSNLISKNRLSSGYRTPPSSLHSSQDSASLHQRNLDRSSNSRWSGASNHFDRSSTKDMDTDDNIHQFATDGKFQYSSNAVNTHENDAESSQSLLHSNENLETNVLDKEILDQSSEIQNSYFDTKCHDIQGQVPSNSDDSNKIDSTATLTPMTSSIQNQTLPPTGQDENVFNEVDDQVEYMKRRARERAEERRAEEEARMNEQKERAARRLKELEEKMQQENNSVDDLKQEKKNWRVQQLKPLLSSAEYRSTQKSSEIILERLGRPNEKKNLPHETKGSAKHNSTNSASARKLYDPNRSYSSLVGGATSSKGQSKMQYQRGSSPPPVLQISLNLPSNDQTFDHSNDEDVGRHSPPPVAMIQLNGYEDRDRGQRNMSSGPRMLFDPKSGSMIQVPSLDKRNIHQYSDDLTQAGKGRKDRSKQKSRIRDRDSSKGENGTISTYTKRSDTYNTMTLDDSNRRRNQYEEIDESMDAKGMRRQRKKEESNGYRKENKRIERETRYKKNHSSHSDGVFQRQGLIYEDNISSSQGTGRRYGNRLAQVRSSGSNEINKLPRTRGVLYKIDKFGNYVCADGCEADQGYGAHSVPGGRIRNPSAHAEYLIHCQVWQQSLSETSSILNEYDPNNVGHNYHQSNFTKSMGSGEFMQTRSSGFDFRKDNYNYGQLNVTSGSASFNYKQQHKENNMHNKNIDEMVQNEQDNYEIPAQLRVKANETLSILSGVPDSPELQATANPWAPNEAALAAAAANSSAQINNSQGNKSDNSESSRNVTAEMMKIIDESEDNMDDDEDDSNESYIGLGFDPTENMDSMMMSPAIDSSKLNDEICNMVNLSLEPSESNANSNPFAPLSTPTRFLGSSTWGTGGPLSRSPGADPIASLPIGSLNWGLDSASKADQAISAMDMKQMNSASTFLSLSSLPINQDGDAWGSSRIGGGLTGLGGTKLEGSQHGHDSN